MSNNTTNFNIVAIEELVTKVQPATTLGACVAIIDKLVAQSVGEGKGMLPSAWYSSIYHDFTYLFRRGLIIKIVDLLGEGDTQLNHTVLIDLDAQGIFLASANWLNWNNSFDLSERYNTGLIKKENTGLVLRHYLPLMAATLATTNTHFAELMRLTPMKVRRDAMQDASDYVYHVYRKKGMSDADIDLEKKRAYDFLTGLIGATPNGYDPASKTFLN